MRTFFAYDPADSQELRQQKFAAFLLAGSCCVAGLIWFAMYYVVFGWGTIAALPLSFVVIVGLALVVSHLSRNHLYAVNAQIICIMGITGLIQWNIGGALDSGLVLFWGFCGPICALVFYSVRQSIPWFLLFLGMVLITALLDESFHANRESVSHDLQIFFFAMNFITASTVVFIFAGYYVSSATAEREKVDRLLLNVLPAEIAPILKDSDETIAESFDSASVLFADIVGSTPLFATLSPEEAVDWLNEVFVMFDRLVEHHGLEKIRTIGDNYMVASGVPTPRADHAEAIALLALDMLRGLTQIPARDGKRIEFRIGINSGPMVGGVIGRTKFHYDLWGDAVNVASRMESHGEVGRVQIGRATYELLGDEFICEPRGTIQVKGKGEMECWFLNDHRLSAPSAAG